MILQGARTFTMRLSAEGRTDGDGRDHWDAENPAEGFMDLMSAFSVSLCFLNRELQVVRANLAARAFIGEKNGDSLLRLLDRSVSCKPSCLRKQLRDAIDSSTPTSLILRTDEFQPLICTVRPVQTELGAYGIVALMPLTGGSTAVIPSLRDIYKLSQAEAEIALGSAAGLDVVELAQVRQVSINTLRAQIASIKSKMGLSRMTEIAVVVCRIEAAATWL